MSNVEDEFLLSVEEPIDKNPIYLFRVINVLIATVAVFFAVSSILCFTSKECPGHVPSLHNLLENPFSLPFIVTGLNTVLSIHGLLVICLYVLTKDRSFYGSRIQVIAALGLYMMIGIVLFVFPFSYRVNYASVLVILGIATWMIAVMITLKTFYKGNLNTKRKHQPLLLAAFCLYIVSTSIYVGLKFSFQSQLGILVMEIVCGFSIGTFLLQVLYHVGNMRIIIVK